ncbi:MAG: PAS domain S-box protein, partial [Chloroflexi bacterium]|nr:PAS domain S-box protein [Chloroflexota bacterium]
IGLYRDVMACQGFRDSVEHRLADPHARFRHLSGRAVPFLPFARGNDRVTNNPLIVKAIKLSGDNKADVVVASASQDRAVLANLFTIPQSQWFATAKAGRPYFGGVRISSGDEPYLIIALPAFDSGVVATRLKMDVLWNVVGNIRFGKAGHAYVVDQTGNVIAHTDPGVVLAETTIAGRPEILNTLSAADRQWSGEYRNLGGADVVGVTGPIGRTEWTIVTELPQAEAYQYSRSAIVMIGGGMLAISIIMIGLLRRNLRRLVFQPMTQLQTGAERIGQGDLSYRVRLIRQDEIGRVAQAFDDMAEHLQQRDRQVAEQNAALAAEVLERQRAEETLHASETQLRRITDNMRDVISEIDAQGNILYASSSHLWVLGCRPEEVLGQPIYERLHPDDAPAALLGLAAALETNTTPEAVTFRYRHTDGYYVWMECTATLLYDDAGEPTGAILSSRDVTQRRSIENSLRDSEARYRAIVEDQTELICRWQPDGTLTFVNEAYCRYFDRTRDQLIGHSYMPLIPEEDHTLIKLATANFSPDRPVATYEHRVNLPDGSLRWQQWTDRAIYDAQGRLIEFASVGRDITDRKRAEAALRQHDAYLTALHEISPRLVS